MTDGARLEIWSPEAAFERLDDWLRSHGFFASEGEDLIADVFLAYRLGDSLRRTRTPSPPEPCRLPLIAASIRREEYVVDNDNVTPDDAISIGDWTRSWSPTAYAAGVESVRRAIEAGDVYQVNLVQHVEAPFRGEPGAVAARLRPLVNDNREPLVGDGWSIVSASPELFLARRGERVWTMPIKGTRPAGRGAELLASPKDAAEHVMIVDLERNDLSRVCRPGSVRWPELMVERSLAGVSHLVSTVEGVLRDDVRLPELLQATFPGGSVTGAPKIAALDLIAAIEPVGRGASMGALGWIRGNGDIELALTIRTFAIVDDTIHLWVGGGVVWDSDPVDEVEESLTKARPLLAALDAPLPPARPVRSLGEPARR